MKPRIFISSTFYDLKYIREDLANFVNSYNYEPILFEDGDIGYTPGRSLDKSCYETMKNSDMVILVIGGEYGSAADGEKADGFDEYISITRNEFRTAVSSGIPIFAMIDRKVMAEFKVYEANFDAIEKKRQIVNFAVTKNINVFRFVSEIRGIIKIPIQEFDRAEDIKQFIGKQWADMFKSYLNELKSPPDNNLEKRLKTLEDRVFTVFNEILKRNENDGPVKKLLWVDDCPINNELVINFLRSKNIHVDIAISTEEGLNFFISNKYDVIITDMARGIERDAGITLIKKLKAQDCKTPIIVYTSQSGLCQYGTQALNLGANKVTNGTADIISSLSEFLKLEPTTLKWATKVFNGTAWD